MTYTDHHPFCNYWNTPLETCRQCARLYVSFPLTNEEVAEFMKGNTETLDKKVREKYPDAIPIPAPKPPELTFTTLATHEITS